jgi:hypothetical protein
LFCSLSFSLSLSIVRRSTKIYHYNTVIGVIDCPVEIVSTQCVAHMLQNQKTKFRKQWDSCYYSFFFTFEFQFFLSIFLIYCHYFSLKFYLNEEMQEISITNFFSEGQPQKFNFELKIEEFEIAFLQLSNTRNYFYSFFSTLLHQALRLNLLMKFYWKKKFEKNWKFYENFEFFSNFFFEKNIESECKRTAWSRRIQKSLFKKFWVLDSCWNAISNS